ncbi:hypothetical protein A0256_14175 [Mucilaginibacter sp. PAMC 26640]|nr:hypothetical protein A0256_14175 [Mucilaginibacter sp. PAMC 26640]
MRIADWQRHPIYIMEDAGVKTGIAFCDLQLPSRFSTCPAIQDQNFPVVAEGTNISELWLVFVANGLTSRSPFFKELIDSYDLPAVFDKIFLFDFFQSAIHIIKSHENHD